MSDELISVVIVVLVVGAILADARHSMGKPRPRPTTAARPWI